MSRTMADHYVKLWASILDSSVWRQPEAHRVVWITMLAMSDKNGFVGASVDGLARRANVAEEQVEEALAAFLAPDPRSRNTDNDGVRIQVVPRGWHILNHEYFRNLQDREMLREYERARKAEQRSRSRGVPDSMGQDEDNTGHPEECPLPYADAGTASGTEQSTRTKRGKQAAKPDDVSDEVWSDWLTHRKAIKAPLTQTAMDGIARESAKASVAIQDALQEAMSRGWRSWKAEWRSSNSGAPGRFGGKPAEPPRNTGRSAASMMVVHDPDDLKCGCEKCEVDRRRASGYGERVQVDQPKRGATA